MLLSMASGFFFAFKKSLIGRTGAKYIELEGAVFSQLPIFPLDQGNVYF